MLYKKIKLNIQRFAVTYTQTLTQVSQDIPNNTSQVRYVVKVTTTGSSHNGNTLTCTYYINGTKYTSTSTLPANTTTTIVNKTIPVLHNNDGSKTVNASFSFPTGISAGTLSDKTSKVLTKIPRESSIGNITGNQIGSEISFPIVSNSTSFKHKVWFKFGGSVWAGIYGTTATSEKNIKYTPPLSTFARYCTDGMVETAYVKIQTYASDGTTKIGGEVTKSFSMYLPSDGVKPTISGITLNETTPYASMFGSYISGKSQINMSINASGYYCDIARYELYLDDNTLSLTKDIQNVIIWSPGVHYLKAKVYDTRGNNAEYTLSLPISNYFEPQITEFIAEREPNNDSKLNLSIKGNICNISNNNLNGRNFVLSYKNETTGQTGNIYTNSTDYSVDYQTTMDVSSDNSYIIYYLISDSVITGGVSANRGVETAFTLLNFNSQGNGIGFGKVCESENTVESNLNLKICNGKDLVFNPADDNDDDGDIVFYYKNGQEKCRIYSPNVMDGNNPYLLFRSFKKNGELITARQLPNVAETYMQILFERYDYVFQNNWGNLDITIPRVYYSNGNITRSSGKPYEVKILEAGYYYVSSQVDIMTPGGDAALTIKYTRNGVAEDYVSQYFSSNGSWDGFNTCDIRYFNSGDRIRMNMMMNKPGTYNLLNGNLIVFKID